MPGKELNLDPTDWEQTEELGKKMLHDMLKHLREVRERPIMKRPPEEVMAAFRQPPPMTGEGAEKAYKDFTELVLSHQSNFNKDPRFWGFVVGTGSPSGMLADMLTSGLNVNMVGGPLVSTMLEMQVTAWIKGMVGFPMTAGGILVSGGTMANLLGLTVARNTKSGVNLREKGVQGIEGKLIIYASTEAHVCIQKSIEMLGIGNENLHRVPVTKDYSMDTTALREMIKQDREAGHTPIAVVACAGTVNTGAFDPINQIADICEGEDLWLHVDGAFGAWATITQKYKHLTEGMTRADSLALDLHKWMYMPYDVGCALFKNPEQQIKTFSERPDYYNMSKDTPPQFADLGFELSRSFRALKIWMGIKEHGVAKYSMLIQQNIDQAQHLTELIKKQPTLELMAPTPLNTVCFRYNDPAIPDEALDELNHNLTMRLMFSGAGAPSETKIKGRKVLRVCITNHRTTTKDLEHFINSAAQMGAMMAAELKKN
ncbi:pyridoxal-dependent decarboxylase [Candidatus Bathyarchaeota archaeon]|nr:pyridoxal-dependent decarboxylase [Candidatus Bathyarchaeota archaeon]